jgi:hypothetical protein
MAFELLDISYTKWNKLDSGCLLISLSSANRRNWCSNLHSAIKLLADVVFSWKITVEGLWLSLFYFSFFCDFKLLRTFGIIDFFPKTLGCLPVTWPGLTGAKNKFSF